MINLALTVEQTNLILAALGQRPYVDVADLIHRIKIEAEKQLAASHFETVEPTED
jgi:hypothetical protein